MANFIKGDEIDWFAADVCGFGRTLYALARVVLDSNLRFSAPEAVTAEDFPLIRDKPVPWEQTFVRRMMDKLEGSEPGVEAYQWVVEVCEHEEKWFQGLTAVLEEATHLSPSKRVTASCLSASLCALYEQLC